MDTIWSYGITTVSSRADNLLPQTVQSLREAGFDKPTIFLDENPHVGHLENWIRALTHLYENKEATRYAIFEDDLLACKNLKLYLDSCPFPETGYWNLITHKEYAEKANGRTGWHLSSQKGRGAVGLVFNRKAVEILLDPHRRKKTKGADGMVLKTLHPFFQEYIHYPGLLQHTGLESTRDHKFGAMKSFAGEDYDPLQLL